jgi:hypothetical protein
MREPAKLVKAPCSIICVTIRQRSTVMQSVAGPMLEVGAVSQKAEETQRARLTLEWPARNPGAHF